MREPSTVRGIGFWIAVVIGWALILVGVRYYVTTRGTADAINVATWVVGGNIVHDAVLVPIALFVGAILTRFVREPWRTPVRAGFLASACVLLVAIPVVGGFGRKAANPSLLPLDYGTAVLWALAIVWALAVAWFVLRIATARSR